MASRTWKWLSATLAAALIVSVAAIIPGIANAGVSGSVGNGPMVFQSGTYTPTLTSSTNVAAYDVRDAHYTRVGDVVTVSGRIDVQVSSNANTYTDFVLSVPISSAFSSTAYDLSGSGAIDDVIPGPSAVGINTEFNGSTAGTGARFMYYSHANSTAVKKVLWYTFTYLVR